MKIAYLTNRFPCVVEPYVMDEITGLRSRGIEVLASSARRAGVVPPDLRGWNKETLYLQAPRFWAVLRALVRCCSAYRQLGPFLIRIFSGDEAIVQRAKALVHTFLGVYYTELLHKENVDHIHVHHGYFSSWIAMVAARLLGISYSMTLHGSDLLVKGAYLDIKLACCNICFTVSEYNRQVIFRRYPKIQHQKIVLRRLGVDVLELGPAESTESGCDHRFVLLVPGRLHAIKNHAFLVTACAVLKAAGFDFVCFVAGDGPERKRIERQIRKLGLEREIKLLGHVAHEDLKAIYPLADLVVLTSKSEGVPVVLMEAMAHGCAVLAPNITGVPELVVDGKTGFLYQPGSIGDFVSHVAFVRGSADTQHALPRAARDHVSAQFNRAVNLENFIKTLSAKLCPKSLDANPLLQ